MERLAIDHSVTPPSIGGSPAEMDGSPTFDGGYSPASLDGAAALISRWTHENFLTRTMPACA